MEIYILFINRVPNITLGIIVELHLLFFLENSLALSYILGLRMKWKRTNYYPNPK